MDIRNLFKKSINKGKPLSESKVEIIVVLSIMAIALILSLLFAI